MQIFKQEEILLESNFLNFAAFHSVYNWLINFLKDI